MWHIDTIEAELSSPGVYSYSFRAEHEGQDEDQGEQVLVLVEQLDGESDGLEVKVTGEIELAEVSKYARVKLFVGRCPGAMREFGVTIYSETAKRIRITFARIREGLEAAWQKLPCRICKQIVKLVLTMVLAAIGIPYLDTEFITLTEDEVAAFMSVLDGDHDSPLADFIRNLNWNLLFAIGTVLGGLNFVFDLSDHFFTMICRILGFCS